MYIMNRDNHVSFAQALQRQGKRYDTADRNARLQIATKSTLASAVDVDAIGFTDRYIHKITSFTDEEHQEARAQLFV